MTLGKIVDQLIAGETVTVPVYSVDYIADVIGTRQGDFILSVTIRAGQATISAQQNVGAEPQPSQPAQDTH